MFTYLREQVLGIDLYSNSLCTQPTTGTFSRHPKSIAKPNVMSRFYRRISFDISYSMVYNPGMEEQGFMSDQSPIQSYPTVESRKRGNGGKLWILIVVVVLAIIGFLVFRPKESQPTQQPTLTISPTQEVEQITVTETPDTSVTPSPTEKVATKKSTGPSIQVQNGSGEEGVAGKMKTALEDLGYDTIETANADNFDYKNVTIKAKDSASAEATKIKSLLKDYTVESEVATLSDDSDFDIIVIVGK